MPERQESDEDLARRAIDGDRAAAGLLCKQLKPYLDQVIRKNSEHGQLQDLDDIRQETLSRLLEKLSTWRGKATIRSWAAVIAVNYMTDCSRKAARGGARIEGIDLNTIADPGEDHWSLKRKECIDLKIEHLRSPYKEVFAMRFQEKLPIEEIAKKMGLVVSSIDKYISTIKKELGKCRNEED